MLQGLRACLRDRRARDHRVVVSDANGQILAQAIQVAIAFFIPQVLVLAVMENQRRCGRVRRRVAKPRSSDFAPLDDGIGFPVEFGNS